MPYTLSTNIRGPAGPAGPEGPEGPPGTGTEIPDGAITTARLADSAVTSIKIADGTIATADLGDAQVTLAKLAADSVDSSKIVAGSIQTSDIGADQITSALIAPGAIVDSDVNAAAGIAVSKLAAVGTANRVVATTDGAAVTYQQVVDAMVSASAAIALSKLAAGSSGILKSNGTAISAGNQIVSADITDATIATGDLAAEAVSVRRLQHTATTDVHSGTAVSSGPTKATLIASQSFTVDSPSSLVGIAVRANALASSTLANAMCNMTVTVDSTDVSVGAATVAVASGFAALAGSGTVWLTGLAAGSHTVSLSFLSVSGNHTLYFRAATQPLTEFGTVTVVELKR